MQNWFNKNIGSYTKNVKLDKDRALIIFENKIYKEIISKAINKLEKGISFCKHDSQGVYDKCNMTILREQEILDILKEVEHE